MQCSVVVSMSWHCHMKGSYRSPNNADFVHWTNDDVRQRVSLPGTARASRKDSWWASSSEIALNDTIPKFETMMPIRNGGKSYKVNYQCIFKCRFLAFWFKFQLSLILGVPSNNMSMLLLVMALRRTGKPYTKHCCLNLQAYMCISRPHCISTPSTTRFHDLLWAIWKCDHRKTSRLSLIAK